MITLKVKTPVDREIHTGGHRGKSFYVSPCDIHVFSGDVLLETLDAAGNVDYRAALIAVEGNSPVDVHLQKVPARQSKPAPQPKPAAKPAPQPKKSPRGGRGDK